MAETSLQLGVSLPLSDIGGDPGVLKEYAQTAEALGYTHLAAADHVLGANVANRPDWGNRNTSEDLFHDPFVLFGFLSNCTKQIGFSTQVLILAQRQAVLVAKQAASVDVLSGGRFRLGVGIGWNPVEFVGLNENFNNRGRRSEEQVTVMQALWRDKHVTFKGTWHHIDDAGINPLPGSGSIPIWFGGHHTETLKRTAKFGEGWIMLAYPPGDEALAAFASLRRFASEAGRDPAAIGIETWVSMGDGDENEWRRQLQFWKEAGLSHITLNNSFGRYYHTRIADQSLSGHLTAMKRYREVVADLL